MADKKGFLNYLYSLGYKVFGNNNKELNSMPVNWSSNGPAMVYLIKDGDVENKIYWGICNGLVIETTDTLRYPLPFGIINEQAEVKMREVFKNHTPEEIYKSMFK